ncbi:hypothetical protein GWK48_10890 [Metallosphaera tengchongensis]|uniref:Hemerythrin-like domain-containing protein n=1 Tax=Metallosphaera tengchongensis TaxID=1532350 RepID=A0A6N0NVQ8_9CREN|nr:hypothetical protein [Metallosphaera tengchongensis]QKR00822.1 hypothetical protein GWK48_10890 [Metallosphaera tengchongensis]
MGWKGEIEEEHEIIEKATKALLYSMAIKRLLGDPSLFQEVLPFYVDFYRNFVVRCHHKKEDLIAEEAKFGEVVDQHPALSKLAEDAFKREELLGDLVEAMLLHVKEERKRWLSKVDGDYSEILEEVEEEIGTDVHRRYVSLVQKLYGKVTEKYEVTDLLGGKPGEGRGVLITDKEPPAQRRVQISQGIWASVGD